MALNPIVVASPFFFVLIVLEVARLRQQNKEFRFNDAITDLGCGLGDRICSVFAKTFLIIPYMALYEEYALFELSTMSPWTWVIGMLGVDFFYYFYHRFSHRVNIGWASHVVHHQSEEYNLCVALRQPWFGRTIGWFFYLPLAILGLPVEVYATCYAINLVYQFWIHTETIDRLGPLEWVLNTPSHHRVHHGTNPVYVDRNYAGILIIWDRMFGTFEEEKEPVLYGTLKPLRSWNPVWANVQPWIAIAQHAGAQERLIDKIKVWFKPPGWTPAGEQDPTPLFNGPDRGYAVDHAQGRYGYIILNLALVTLVVALMVSYANMVSPFYLVLASALCFWTMLNWGGFFEGRRWSTPAEITRVVTIVLVAVLMVAT